MFNFFPQVAAKCTNNKLQIKKNVMRKDRKVKQFQLKQFFSIQITLSRC